MALPSLRRALSRHRGGWAIPARTLVAGIAALLLSAIPARGDHLEGEGCRVEFPPHARAQAERLRDGFPPRRRAIAAWLGVEPRGEPILWLVEDHAGMRERGGPRVPEWAVAVARRDDVLVFRLDKIDRGPANSLERVLTHEVVHQVLGHVGGFPLPRWFEEGLCVLRAGRPFLETDSTVGRLAAGGNLPVLAAVDSGFAGGAREAGNSYQVGAAAATHFVERFGVEVLRRLLDLVGEGKPFEAAFRLATGETVGVFEEGFRRAVTPRLPFLLFILWENLGVTIWAFASMLVVFGYVRRRLRREAEMARLDTTL